MVWQVIKQRIEIGYIIDTVEAGRTAHAKPIATGRPSGIPTALVRRMPLTGSPGKDRNIAILGGMPEKAVRMTEITLSGVGAGIAAKSRRIAPTAMQQEKHWRRTC